MERKNMSTDQIEELTSLFLGAMTDWDVPVTVDVIDGESAEVSFTLWSTKFEGQFSYKNGWHDDSDCPHYIEDFESVWQWIAMQLHDKLTA